jgi:hypothetical protein
MACRCIIFRGQLYSFGVVPSPFIIISAVEAWYKYKKFRGEIMNTCAL